MLSVPLYVEALRTRPALVFALATLAQTALWVLVPMVFFAAPPGDLPQVLAIGRQFPLRGDFGPPLAYWLAEAAFRAGGLFGVYLLAQLCVATTYACVFLLGSAIVGASHAALAVLMMTGISVFTVPTPDFGPPLLTAALWALLLLHYWRAVGQKRRASWFVLGGAAALLLAASTVAVILVGLVVVFTAATARGRASLRGNEPIMVVIALGCFLVLHVFWLGEPGGRLLSAFGRLRGAETAGGNTAAWLRLLGGLVIAHAGLAILVVLASGWPRVFGPAPAFVRAPIEPFARTYLKTFALAPALAATVAAVLFGERLPIGGFAPLLVLSGLAVIVAAGERVTLHHPRIVGYAWAGLLVVPVIFVPLVIAVLPWATATDLKVAQPANAMGRFFAESFERRTGRPLAIVSGDETLAALVAIGAPSQPRVDLAADPARSPWVTAQDVAALGAVVVWPAASTSAEPPPAIRERFPDLAAEVPKTFDRPVRGRLPPLRIGWGVIRPAGAPAPPTAPR
jgi:hypothetical protein